jgi:hypothetical protein
VRLAAEQVVGREAAHLLPRRFDQPLLAEAEIGAPQAGHALEIAVAVLVEHVHPLAPGQHHRPFLYVMGEVGERVNDRADVACGQGVDRLHDAAPILRWRTGAANLPGGATLDFCNL